MANRQALALYEHTSSLQGCRADRKNAGGQAPRRHVPIGLLRWLLMIPGLAARFAISAESLDFIQTQRFDMSNSEQLELKYQLTHPDMARALEKTVRYVKDHFLH
jgi:hypothetical protein